MKKTANNDHTNWHHIIPESIGGPDIPENKYRWNKKRHEAYHQLFRNHLPSIVIKIIKEWTDKNGDLDRRKLSVKDFQAWRKAFGKQIPEEIIEFLENKFLPVEEKYLKGELGGKEK